MKLGLGLSLTSRAYLQGALQPPPGFQFLIGADGAQLLGADGAPLYGKAA